MKTAKPRLPYPAENLNFFLARIPSPLAGINQLAADIALVRRKNPDISIVWLLIVVILLYLKTIVAEAGSNSPSRLQGENKSKVSHIQKGLETKKAIADAI